MTTLAWFVVRAVLRYSAELHKAKPLQNSRDIMTSKINIGQITFMHNPLEVP